MRFIFLLLLTSVFSHKAHASSFGEAASKCFGTSIVCKTGMPCSDDATAKEVSCYEAMGLSKSECKFRRQEAVCSASFTEKLFPFTKNCILELSGSREDKLLFATIKKDEKSNGSCMFHGYSVSDEHGSRVSVIDAKRTGKAWSHEVPKMSVGFEQVLGKADMQISHIGGSGKFEPYFPPWKTVIDGEYDRPYEPCDKTLDSLKTVADRRGALFSKSRLEFFGYDNVVAAVGKKHFGGLGAKDTSTVLRFTNIREFKLCGRSIPPNTDMSYALFDSATCFAVTPGAVSLLLPASLFPDASELPKNQSQSDRVKCSPKAKKLSSFVQLIGESNGNKSPISIPKLNWQDCDCEYADPYAKLR